MSPVLFAVFMDVLIVRVRKCGVGCKLVDGFYGCLFYADDILLLSPSIKVVRLMLVICEQFALEFIVKFNASKSVAIGVGPCFNAKCAPSLTLCGTELKFVSIVKYLGVHMIAARVFKVSVEHIKVKFYRVFNYVYSRAKAANSEIIIVELMKAYCLPFLSYASEAVSLSRSNVQILNKCISRAVCKTFGISDSKLVQTMHEAVGLQDITILIERHRERFVDKLIANDEYRDILLCSSCL